MDATTTARRYWNGTGRFSAAAEKLQGMIPMSGTVATPHANPKLERYRKAVNCYYDLYNNGLCNRAAAFSRMFGIRVSEYRYKIRRSGRLIGMIDERIYDAVEPMLDAIVRDAAIEQGFGELVSDVGE
jgi:hypothetical protein